jgi:2-dehydropantoate 2-reductase
VLLADPGWERLLRALMAEVIRAANALGHALPAGLAEENLERTRCMGDYRASTLLDFEAGRPLELDSLFLEPQRLAHQAGVATPVLDALCAVLRELDARQRRAGAH